MPKWSRIYVTINTGSYILRLTPQQHDAIYRAAQSSGHSMVQFVERAVHEASCRITGRDGDDVALDASEALGLSYDEWVRMTVLFAARWTPMVDVLTDMATRDFASA